MLARAAGLACPRRAPFGKPRDEARGCRGRRLAPALPRSVAPGPGQAAPAPPAPPALGERPRRRRLLRRTWLNALDADCITNHVVDSLVRPDAADQQEDSEDECKELLAGGRLDLLRVGTFAPAAFPLFVLGRSSTMSSQSSAFAIRRSVSIRGGRPPDSSRAIADWVVPVSSASSAWRTRCALRCSATCCAICAKNQPWSGSTCASRARSFSRVSALISQE